MPKYPILNWSGGGPADAFEASQSCGVPNVELELKEACILGLAPSRPGVVEGSWGAVGGRYSIGKG